ncbi:MAG TPA: macro domain-containing protein [Thermoanaerobaculia bacterium]|nr:macro domain-containing protein [Thermoanaerobaculia bacterium]
MIRYVTGNLILANVEALVNTVNTVGVMGKGVALQFKEAFPANCHAYQEACKRGEVQIGKMFVTEAGRLDGPRWIVNFPTKKDWRHPSRLEYVRAGLSDLVNVVRERKIRSIALPPLGCGHGGLDWLQVKQAIEGALADLPDVDVVVYEPTDAYQASPKRSGVEELTPARAMLVDAIRRYGVLGLECTNLEVQKLAYFLQRILNCMRIDDPLRLTFLPNKYGPYADALRHMLDSLDGSYLHCQKRLHDAGPMDPIQIDLDRLPTVEDYVARALTKEHRSALEQLDRLIDGFQSPYLMELLSSVDWLLNQRGGDATDGDLLAEIANWPGGKEAARRKARLFKDEAVMLARERLQRESRLLYGAPVT